MGNEFVKKNDEREARCYYRASVFYAAGAIEAFVNYIADSFAKANNLTQHEICFLNDKTLVFKFDDGLREETKYNPLDQKLRFLIRKFVHNFDFQGSTWVAFMEFKKLRDLLAHPRQLDDETISDEYRKKVAKGLKAIIELMSAVTEGMFQKPLRRQLLDLIPD
ncbi:hypothetical protein HY732_04235 [Candidatus Uhrbacteria bacterium]|nr:hypothetical protein [Candidatus Uhrbacteria bacterium]